MPLNCGPGEDSWKSLGQQGDQTSQSYRKSVLNIHWKDLMLKLKLQYLGHLMQRADLLEKTLMLGKTEGRRRTDARGWAGWMVSLSQWPWVEQSSRRWWRTCWSPWGHKQLDMTEQLSTAQQQDPIMVFLNSFGDVIQPSYSLSSPSPTALNLSQHQGFFQWSALCNRWPKYWSFSLSPSMSIPGWFLWGLTGLIS